MVVENLKCIKNDCIWMVLPHGFIPQQLKSIAVNPVIRVNRNDIITCCNG